MHEPQANDQGKCSAPKTSIELTCYRCKVQGHIAKACPTRDCSTKSEPEQTDCHKPQVSEVQNLVQDVDNLKVSHIPKQSGFKNSNSSIMHLLFPLSVDVGTCILEDFKDQVEATFRQSMLSDQIKNQDVLDTVMLKTLIEEADSVIDTLLTKDEPTESPRRTKVQGKHNGETNSKI